MKSKDAEIDVLKKKWQEYQEVQDRLSGYEKDRLGEKDLLRKRAEQIDALQHKVKLDRSAPFAFCKKRVVKQGGLTDHLAQGNSPYPGQQHCCTRRLQLEQCSCQLAPAEVIMPRTLPWEPGAVTFLNCSCVAVAVSLPQQQ